jgi:hypothetical protein
MNGYDQHGLVDKLAAAEAYHNEDEAFREERRRRAEEGEDV